MILSTQDNLFKFKYLIADLIKEITSITQYKARRRKKEDGTNDIEEGAIDEEDKTLIEGFIEQGAKRAFNILLFLVNGVTIAAGLGAKQKEVITLIGTNGTANIAYTGGLTKVVTFRIDKATTASDFAAANAVAYSALNIALSAYGDTLQFESMVTGQPFTAPVISVVTGDLSGSVNHLVENVTKTTRAFSWKEAGTESRDAVVIAVGHKEWMADSVEVELDDKILAVITNYALCEWMKTANLIDDIKIYAALSDKYESELYFSAHQRKKEILTTLSQP
jgi:hypothetical protein